MEKEITFNEWAKLIEAQLSEYYKKQKEETQKKFAQYYR
jgi:hypothetical protein